MKKELKFTGYFMTVNNAQARIETFRNALTEPQYYFPYESIHFTFYPQFVEHFLYIPMTHGSPYPLPENVININTNLPETNPRRADQYEPKQDFAVVDFNTGYVWVSSTHRKIVLWTFFFEKLRGYEVVLKEVFDKDNFIKTIKTIDNIKMSAVPNIFSATNTLANELANEIHGYEAAVATLIFNYKNKIVGDGLKEKLKSIMGAPGAFKNLMIAGKDANNIGVFFNSETIMRKVNIRTELNPNGTYNPDDVWSKIKKELK